MRLINADALMEAMAHRAFETDGDTMWQSGCWVRYRAIEQVMKKQPTIEPEPHWIPCSERLPEAEYGEGDSVLCCTELGLMYILYWNGGNWCVPTGEPHQWANHKTGWHDKVIAWMPMPEKYREDNK